MQALLPFFALCGLPFAAPFIITQEDAKETDAQLDRDICGLDKHKFSRYYWYDFVARNGKFEIDPFSVRFAIIDDGKGGVYATAGNPIDEDTLQSLRSFGMYSIADNNLAQLTCVPS